MVEIEEKKCTEIEGAVKSIADLHTQLLKDKQYKNLYDIDKSGKPKDPLAHLQKYNEKMSLKIELPPDDKIIELRKKSVVSGTRPVCDKPPLEIHPISFRGNSERTSQDTKFMKID